MRLIISCIAGHYMFICGFSTDEQPSIVESDKIQLLFPNDSPQTNLVVSGEFCLSAKRKNSISSTKYILSKANTIDKQLSLDLKYNMANTSMLYIKATTLPTPKYDSHNDNMHKSPTDMSIKDKPYDKETMLQHWSYVPDFLSIKMACVMFSYDEELPENLFVFGKFRDNLLCKTTKIFSYDMNTAIGITNAVTFASFPLEALVLSAIIGCNVETTETQNYVGNPDAKRESALIMELYLDNLCNCISTGCNLTYLSQSTSNNIQEAKQVVVLQGMISSNYKLYNYTNLVSASVMIIPKMSWFEIIDINTPPVVLSLEYNVNDIVWKNIGFDFKLMYSRTCSSMQSLSKFVVTKPNLQKNIVPNGVGKNLFLHISDIGLNIDHPMAFINKLYLTCVITNLLYNCTLELDLGIGFGKIPLPSPHNIVKNTAPHNPTYSANFGFSYNIVVKYVM